LLRCFADSWLSFFATQPSATEPIDLITNKITGRNASWLSSIAGYLQFQTVAATDDSAAIRFDTLRVPCDSLAPRERAYVKTAKIGRKTFSGEHSHAILDGSRSAKREND